MEAATLNNCHTANAGAQEALKQSAGWEHSQSLGV